jgi:hypothetical protein
MSAVTWLILCIVAIAIIGVAFGILDNEDPD